MHLTTLDKVISPDTNPNEDTLNKHPIEQIASSRSNDIFDKEQQRRTVYIALRESKPPGTTTMQHETMIEKNIIDERLSIMPSLDDDEIVGGDVEYVTLEDCRLIAGEDFNVDGMTDVSHLRDTALHNSSSGVKVLVQPLFAQTENLQTSEFIMPMQSLPQQHASRSNTTQSNMLPNSSFNPSLPTEPLPYEETLEIQKCVMDVTSPNEKENTAKSDESMKSTSNITYLDSSVPSMQYGHMQIHETVYPTNNDMRNFNTHCNGLHGSPQFDTRNNESKPTATSPEISFKQVASPPSSSSPTYSLSESPYIHTSTAIDNQSSRRVSTNFDSNGPVSPSESSSSYGSQESSISSSSKRCMSIEEKRLRLYSESWTPSTPTVPSSRARHQSDGLVGCRTRTKQLQTSRSSVDRKNSGNSVGKRRSKNPMPEKSKDDKYWRRRAKNNEAAKRSREAKRQKEDEVQQKVEVLENERDLLRNKLEEALSEIRMLKERLNKDQE